MKYSWNGHKDRNRHKNRIKRSGQTRLVYVIDINRNIPTTWRWARGDILMSTQWLLDTVVLIYCGAGTQWHWYTSSPSRWNIVMSDYQVSPEFVDVAPFRTDFAGPKICDEDERKKEKKKGRFVHCPLLPLTPFPLNSLMSSSVVDWAHSTN